jgi:acetylornithine deacetylase
LVGPPSLHAAKLAGGSGLSTYAAKCNLIIERRTVPGETFVGAMRELFGIIDQLHAEDPSFDGRAWLNFERQPFEVDRSAAIVTCVHRATRAVLGRDPEYFGDTPWMDSALLSDAGIETVVIGPHGAGAHADVEWVDLESVEQLAGVLVRAAMDYCA